MRRIAAEDVPRQSVSSRAHRRQLDPAAFERRASAGSVSFGLPEIGCPRLHGALVLSYETNAAARVATSIASSDGLRAHGKAFAVDPSEGRARRLEIPLPDFARMRVRVDAVSAGRMGAPLEFSIDRAHVACDPADEDRRIAILSRGANSLRVALTALPGDRILTFLDPHYPGWRAYLDGEPASILLADDAFKAVAVPPGTHEVEFAFRPTRVYVGIAISLASALGALSLLVLLRSRSEPPERLRRARRIR